MNSAVASIPPSFKAAANFPTSSRVSWLIARAVSRVLVVLRGCVNPESGRLCRQPDGFEGLCRVHVRAYPPELPTAKAISNPDQLISTGPAAFSLPHHPEYGGGLLIARVEDSEIFDLPFLPCLVHGREVVEPDVRPSVRRAARLDRGHQRDEFQVLVRDC